MTHKEIQRSEVEPRIFIRIRNLGKIVLEASRKAGLPESLMGTGFDGQAWTWEWRTPVGTKGGEAISTTAVMAHPDTLEEDILEIEIIASAYLNERRNIAWSARYFSERLNSVVLGRGSKHTRGVTERIKGALKEAWGDATSKAQLLPSLAENRQRLINELRARGLLHNQL